MQLDGPVLSTSKASGEGKLQLPVPRWSITPRASRPPRACFPAGPSAARSQAEEGYLRGYWARRPSTLQYGACRRQTAWLKI
ncbi:unnamed protein product, partial [Prorocentrum cordatum]